MQPETVTIQALWCEVLGPKPPLALLFSYPDFPSGTLDSSFDAFVSYILFKIPLILMV